MSTYRDELGPYFQDAVLGDSAKCLSMVAFLDEFAPSVTAEHSGAPLSQSVTDRLIRICVLAEKAKKESP